MIKNIVLRFSADEDGVTAVEYGILAILVATALIATVPTLQDALTAAFTAINAKVTAAST